MSKATLSILVALHGGGLSGIDTYAEHIAAAAAAEGHAITLLALEPAAVNALRDRLADTAITVVPTAGLSDTRSARLARQIPTTALVELRELTAVALAARGARFDVAHLNHPALAPAVRPFAARVATGAWFYPHRPLERMSETWRHTGRQFPRSAAYAVKGLAHYLNDRYGYRRSDAVAAPTERLAVELRSSRVPATAVPPPAAMGEDVIEPVDRTRGLCRVMICCGDLGHPRKNVSAGIAAVGLLGHDGRRIELVLAGGHAEAVSAALRSLPGSITVRTTGRLPRRDIQRWMAGSDVLLVPSLYEEWGYVATEAMTIGTPVAAFPVYPFDEVLVRPLGISAGEMSPRSLARAMEIVIEMGRDRSAVREAAVASFGAAEVMRRLEALWTSKVGIPEPAPADAHAVAS